MNEQEFNKLVEKVGEATAKMIDAQINELRGGFITEEQLLSSVEGFAKSQEVVDLSKKMDDLAVDLKKMFQDKEKEVVKSFRDQILENYDSVKEKLFKNGKALLDLKTNVTVGSSITDDTGAYRIPGFGQAAIRGLVFEQYFSRVPLPPDHHGTIRYVDQTTLTRSAATKAEAAAAPESAIAWTEYSLDMYKILDSIPMTHEAMNDVAGLVAEVELFIQNNMRLALDTKMATGSGSSDWTGIYTAATDFTQAIAVGAGVDAIDGANLYDLIATIDTYISNGKESKFQPNVCFVNPRDALKMKVVKNANDDYIIPPYVSRDGNMVGGVVVVPTAAITANTLVMGDGRHVRYYDVEGIQLEYGLDSDDFTKDLITLKARKRGNLLLRNVDATAFYKVTDVAQRITDITA